ncbi:MAG: hypothetical protein WAL90_00165 [Desulfobacterales bacterium]
MVLPELIKAFQERYLDVRGVFYETLPAGIIEQQLKSGRLVIGNLKIIRMFL